MPPSEAVCVALHDVAPATWPECRRLLAMLDDIGRIPVTLLVVPDFHRRGRFDGDTAFLRAMEARLQRGDEIALHGYYHVDDGPVPRTPRDWLQRRVLTDREGEFGILTQAQARLRIEQGLQMLQRQGWPVSGFVAPAWLLGSGARAALGGLPFSYTTIRAGLYRLPGWHLERASAIGYSARSAWRRALSSAVVNVQALRMRKQPLLRLALHPVDAHHDRVIEHWRALVEDALRVRTPLTKAQYAAREQLASASGEGIANSLEAAGERS